jgi:hypothetical protein
MLNQFLSNVIWVDFKTRRVLHEQQTKVKKIPYLCQLKKEHCNANSKISCSYSSKGDALL